MANTTACLNIHCAVYLPLYAPYGHPRIIADLARDAENAWWDGFFVWDDIAGWDKDMADPWIALSAAAMITERVRLGALITPLPRLHQTAGALWECGRARQHSTHSQTVFTSRQCVRRAVRPRPAAR